MADVDAGYFRIWPTHGVLGCLGRTAASDEDCSVVTIGFGRFKQMEVGTPALRIVPTFAVAIEVFNRRRVREVRGREAAEEGHREAEVRRARPW